MACGCQHDRADVDVWVSFAPNYTLDGSGTAYFTTTGTVDYVSTTLYYYIYGPFIPVQVGKTYEFSGYLGNHRVPAANVAIAWADSSGSWLLVNDGNDCPSNVVTLNYLENFCRSARVATAPTGAVKAQLVIKLLFPSDSGNPYMFFTRLQFGERPDGTTVASPWSPGGVTQIAGDLIKTGTITANHVAAGTITASRLSVLAGSGNLLQNSSFENVTDAFTTNWLKYDNGSEATWYGWHSATSHTGTYAYAIAWDNSTNVKGIFCYGANANKTKPYQKYTLSFWARSSSSLSSPSAMEMAWNNPPSDVAWKDNPYLTTAFQRYEVSWTSPSVAESYNFYLTIGVYTQTNNILWLDDIQLQEGDVGTGWAPAPDEILPGTIVGNRLVANTITADKLSVTSLSAINANMGSLTSGSIVVGATNKLWLNDGSDGALNIGGGTKGTAPFRVTATGALTATGASISGTVNATSGWFGDSSNDVSIDADGIVVGSNGRISAGGGSVVINSSGIEVSSGSSNVNRYKFSDGSYLQSSSGYSVFKGSTTTALAGGNTEVQVNANDFTSANNHDLGTSGSPWGTLFLYGDIWWANAPSTTAADYPVVRSSNTALYHKTNVDTNTGCTYFNVDAGLVTSCSDPITPQLRALQVEVSELKSQVAALVALLGGKQ